MKRILPLFAALLFNPNLQAAVHSEPQPVPLPPAIETPQDLPYPGVLKLNVDASDVAHRIFYIKESIPIAQSGPMTLLYARWIPGVHAAVGPLHNFAGLKITANGQPVKWTRDDVDVYAYHIDAPSGARMLDIEAQLVTPTQLDQGVIAVTREMLRLNWYATALYPAGHFSRRIDVEASIKLPASWQLATALEVSNKDGDTVQFKSVSLETLADSPLIAGKHLKTFDLEPATDPAKGRSHIALHAVADEPEQLDAKPAIIELHRELIRQADKLYGARHFDHYDFLLTLSDRLGHAGVEHQRSSDNGTSPRYFTSWDSAFISRDLLAHEYAHSWNGKYRRPADLWTPNFNVPMRGSLLWVYEGQTQYWGNVLTARAGLLTKQQALDHLANVAATYDAQSGRMWRNLQDTTNDPIIASRRALPWRSWQRSEDYYSEGALIWLDVDTMIRERSKNKRSLDHFARAFFSMNDGDWGQLTYTFEDVVDALNKIEPYDWATFLRTRLDENATHAPLDGLQRGGYRLVYIDTQSSYARSDETRRKTVDLMFSLGLVVNLKGDLTAVSWDGPAFKAGLTVGMELVAINGLEFDPEKLRAAVKASKDGAPIDLLIKQGETYRTVRIDYHGGARYPKLERIKETPALLDDILAAKK